MSNKDSQDGSLRKQIGLRFKPCAARNFSISQDNQDPIKSLTPQLLATADVTMPKTSIGSHCKANPWFNEQCKKAIEAWKKAERLFNKHPSTANLTKFINLYSSSPQDH